MSQKPLLSQFLITMLLCLSLSSFAQVKISEEYAHRCYTTQDGLPENKITSIFQDEKGFLWVGTFNGFARFDGFSFRNWQPPIKEIYGIRKGLDGKPIYCTPTTLFQLPFWNKDSVTKLYQLPDSLFTNYNNSFRLPPQYWIWQSADAGKKYLVKQSNSQFELLFKIPLEYETYDVFCYLDTATKLLYVSGNNRLLCINIMTQNSYFIPNVDAWDIFKHSTLGMVYIDMKGIYVLENHVPKKIASYYFDGAVQLLESPKQELFIVDKNNIYRYNNGEINKLGSIPFIKDALFDQDGNFWVSTYSGLYNFFQFDYRNFHIYDNDKQGIMSACADSTNTMWFSSISGQLFKYLHGNIKEYDFAKKSQFGFASGVYLTNGLIYIPSTIGIVFIKNGKFSQLETGPYPCKRIISLANGNLLTPTRSSGMIEFSDNEKIVKRYSMDFMKQRSYSVIQNKNGELLVAGNKGITIINGDSATLILNDRGTICYNITKDKKENIFVSNGDYLCLFKNNKLIDIGYLKGDYINDLLVTKDQILVIASVMGLRLLDINNFDDTKEQHFIKYDHQNGVTLLDPNVDGLYEDCFGRVWMPCTKGVVQFVPNKLLRNLLPPRLHINAFSFSIDNVNWNEITEFENIKLTHNQQNVTFDFIGLLFSAASNVRYYYRVIGFQEEWSETQERRISFNNLPPGKYTFELYADAGTENSKTEIQQLTFEIVPAFWQTSWFFLFSISFLLILTAGITTYIIRKNYYKKTAKMRAEFQLNELRIKSIRLKSIPHFNANVLAAIEYYIMNISKEEANVLLNKYALFTNQTLKDVERPSRSLKEELEYVKLYLELEKLRFRDKFIYEINIDNEVDTESVSLPTMILHTFAENALKHGFVGKTAGFVLKIGALKKEHGVLVFVEDNGVGRKAATDNPIKQSTKQGLAILYQQIEIINQLNENKINYQFIDLVDENDVSLGTRFEIEIPLHYNYI